MPYRAKRLLDGHGIFHAKDQGWTRLDNGRLLGAAAGAGFAVMITVDKKIKYEQNLGQLPLTVIDIDLPDSRLPSIASIADHLEKAIGQAGRFGFITIDRDGRTTLAAQRS